MTIVFTFDHSGTRGKDPKNTPPDCDACQYTEGATHLEKYWDTIHDADAFFQTQRDLALSLLWKSLWDNFHCPPEGKKCGVRKSCSNKPDFVAAWAELVKAPDTNWRWRISVAMGRRIQCVDEGDGKDDKPVFPKIDPPKDPTAQPQAPKPPEKKESDPPKEKGSGDSPKTPSWGGGD